MHTTQFALGGVGIASLMALIGTGAALALRSAGVLRPRHVVVAIALTAASWLVAFRNYSADDQNSNPRWPTPMDQWRTTPGEGNAGSHLARGWPAPYVYAAAGEREPSLHPSGLLADVACIALLAALAEAAAHRWRR